MIPIVKKVVNGVAVASLGLIALGGMLHMAGIRINTSSSIPVGIYWMTKRPIQVGEYVIFCPPNRRVFQEALARHYIHAGFCSGRLGYMMKKVVAEAGDTVTSTPDGVLVNGEHLPYSEPKTRDDRGRALPNWRADHVSLNDSELLLMTDQSARSFDARYFGPISTSQVKAVVIPLMTWPLHPTIERN